MGKLILILLIFVLQGCGSDNTSPIPIARDNSDLEEEEHIDQILDTESVEWIINNGLKKIIVKTVAVLEENRGVKTLTEIAKISDKGNVQYIKRKATVNINLDKGDIVYAYKKDDFTSGFEIEIASTRDEQFSETESQFEDIFSTENKVSINSEIDTDEVHSFLKNRHYLNASRCRQTDFWKKMSTYTIEERGNMVLYNAHTFAMDRLFKRNFYFGIISALELDVKGDFKYLLTAYDSDKRYEVDEKPLDTFTKFTPSVLVDSQKPWASVDFWRYANECDFCYSPPHESSIIPLQYLPFFESKKEKKCSRYVNYMMKLGRDNYRFEDQFENEKEMNTGVNFTQKSIKYLNGIYELIINYSDSFWEVYK